MMYDDWDLLQNNLVERVQVYVEEIRLLIIADRYMKP